jgi:hypothetical protein
MADQAILLGHPREALMLARAGQRGITAEDSPACLSDLQVLEARAHATVGDTAAASRSVARAERTFLKVIPENEPEWARFIDPAYLFGEVANTFRDLGEPAQVERFGGDSARDAMRQGRARRGALTNAAMAVADLQRGEVEAAASRGVRVVDMASMVQSSRTLETVRDLARRLSRFAGVPAVEAFTTRAKLALGLG